MLTSILEHKAVLVYKLGMPLVLVYHLLIGSVFFNTAAEDATGLEKMANTALIPMQYFFEGKKAIPELDADGNTVYRLERRFDYDHHFFMKTAAAFTTLPISITLGTGLKAAAYLSPKTRARAEKLYAARHSPSIHSNLAYYRSIGIQLEESEESPFIDGPRWKRHPDHEDGLAGDVEALEAIATILNAHKIPFWLDCGSCLGTYQYGGAIPNDWDIDLGMLRKDFDNVFNALQALDPDKFVVQDWSGRKHPKSYLKVFVKETGNLIDLYNFEINEETGELYTLLSNEHNIFLPTAWIIREMRYTTPMPFSNVFPRKRALFEGVEVPVPGNTETYLQVFYGENLAPARVYSEITGNYEKDLDHPYWQLPHAH